MKELSKKLLAGEAVSYARSRSYRQKQLDRCAQQVQWYTDRINQANDPDTGRKLDEIIAESERRGCKWNVTEGNGYYTSVTGTYEGRVGLSGYLRLSKTMVSLEVYLSGKGRLFKLEYRKKLITRDYRLDRALGS
jgi:hypothetical protein